VPSKGYRHTEETRAKLRTAWKRRRGRLPDFWDRVEKTEGCWLWRGSSSDGHYGNFQRDGRLYLAHRYAYEDVVGPIPPGLELDHLCRTPACVRPDHLEPVTPKVNQHRGMSPSGINSRKTHCAQGHEFSVQATGKRAGRRRCVECHRERNRQWMRDHYRAVER
jgi:hypothetical protein